MALDTDGLKLSAQMHSS